MNAPTYPALAGIVWLVVVLLMAGCPAGKHMPSERTDPAAALGEGAQKDKAIESEASGIAANPADSAFVSAAAARILDVLRLSPWAKTEATIKALVAERDTASQRADDLAKQLEAANQKTDQMIRLGLAGAGGVCFILAAIAALLVAKVQVLFPGLGKMIVVCVAALGGLFLFAAFAYGWALRHQNLVIGAAAVIVAGAAFLWVSNRHHAAAEKAVPA